MRIDQINKRMIHPGRHIPVNLWRMDNPSLVEDEILSFNYDEDLMEKILSAFHYICQDYSEKGFLVTGLFGVGKSHFLKYVLFCVTPNYQQKAFLHLSQGLTQCTNDPLVSSDMALLQHEIECMSIDTITIDTCQISSPINNLYYWIYKKLLDLKGMGDKPGRILGRTSEPEINLDTICNELHLIVSEKPKNYRLVFFFEDLDLSLGRNMTSIIQLLELLRMFHNEFAGIIRVFCSCQMGGVFYAYYPELYKVINSQMNCYRLFVREQSL